MPPSPPELSVADARSLLRSAGLRCTSCRVAVLQHLAASRAPLSHAEVADVLVPQGFDKSTIYRSLVELAEFGFLSRFDLGDHVWRFEWRTEDETAGADHPHFVCLDCGQVICLTDIEVRFASGDASQRLSSPPGDVTEILLKGRCRRCR